MHNLWSLIRLDEDDRDCLREVAKFAFWYVCFVAVIAAGVLFVRWLLAEL